MARIYEAQLAKFLENLYNERKGLNIQLQSRTLILDVSTVLCKIVLVLVAIMILLYNINFFLDQFLYAVGTVLLAVAFIFARTIAEIFDSLHLLFSVQPFKFGDFVRLNDGQPLRVESLGLLSTYFISADGCGSWVRNSEIARSKLANLNRGDRPSFEVQFGVQFGSSGETISLLQSRLLAYLVQSKVWSSSKFKLLISSLDSQNGMLELRMDLKCKKDWKLSDQSKWKAAKSELLLELSNMLLQLRLVRVPPDFRFPVESGKQELLL